MQLLLPSLLMASVAINIFALSKLYFLSTATTTTPLPTSFQGLDKSKMDLYSHKDHAAMASHALETASLYSGKRGEGRSGWLHLLKAFDYDVSNVDVAENLAHNYAQLPGYSSMGYTLLKQANQEHLLSNASQMAVKIQQQIARWKPHDPGPGCTTLGFATAFATWQLNSTRRFHHDVFQASIRLYAKIKRENPTFTDTELNHELWNVQKQSLDQTESYWGPFQDIPDFPVLVHQMRFAAMRFLGNTHGLKFADHLANHPLVVWVSVHTKHSVHQPHVTQDALVGGVYYITVPKGAGRLELFDPRGKSPLDLKQPLDHSVPPFHRSIGLQPRPGLLVLFPGWLVHSVLPSLDMAEDEYRVSLSLNLKGEWQSTAGLSVGCPTYSE